MYLFSQRNECRIVGDYEIGDTIGVGTCGKVKRGIDIRSGRQVALKIMDLDVFKTRETQQELEILRYFGEPKNKHPNICSLVSIEHAVDLPSKHGEHSSYVERKVSIIVTEYANAGDLFSYLSSGIPFNEVTCRAVFQQVVRGLHHLHKKGVVHLDLKPENILLGRNGIVKLADFGMSEIVIPFKKKKKKKTRMARISVFRRSSPAEPSASTSADSGASQESPLVNFFPTSSNSSFSVPGSPSHFASSPILANLRTADLTPSHEMLLSSPHSDGTSDNVDDDALFDAISKGKTRSSVDEIRQIKSTGNLQDLGIMKSRSFGSVSSLESFESLSSRLSGDSRSRYTSPKLVVSSRNGTLLYQAPEISKGNYDGAKADVYSLGVVLHVMIYGILPYANGEWNRTRIFFEQINPLPETSQVIQEQKFWKNHPITWIEPEMTNAEGIISEAAKDLLRGMLCLNAEERFSLKDVVKHPWVEASQVRGSVQMVAALVQRREPYVKESIAKQSMQRKARKRGYFQSVSGELQDPSKSLLT